MTAEQAGVPTIKPQAKKVADPEVQKYLDEINAAKSKIKAINEAKRAAKVKEKKLEQRLAFKIFRSLVKKLDDKQVREVLISIGKDWAPHEGYTDEMIKEDQASLRELLERK